MVISASILKSRAITVEIDPNFGPKQRELEAQAQCDEAAKRIAENTNKVENPQEFVNLVDRDSMDVEIENIHRNRNSSSSSKKYKEFKRY